MRAGRLAVLHALGLALLLASAGGCGDSAEGEACDLANGNTDCEEGLVCRAGYEVEAGESVCCPRPPNKPSTSACRPKHEGYEPDPSVDAAPIPPGTGGAGGSGGTGGTEAGPDAAEAEAGAAGAAGADAAGDAPSDGAADSSTD